MEIERLEVKVPKELSPLVVIRNAVTPEWCDKMIDLYERTTDAIKGQALLRDIVEEIEVPCGSGELDDVTEELWGWGEVDNEIKALAEKCLKEYLKPYMAEMYEFKYTGTKFLRYPEGSHSPIHYDDELMAKTGTSKGQARPITLVVYLNDYFGGGETLFPDQGAAIKPEKGTVAIFPASYMYPHSTSPSYTQSNGKYRFILLPFFVKSGLNQKLENSAKKLDKFNDPGREFRELLYGEDD